MAYPTVAPTPCPSSDATLRATDIAVATPCQIHAGNSGGAQWGRTYYLQRQKGKIHLWMQICTVQRSNICYLQPFAAACMRCAFLRMRILHPSSTAMCATHTQRREVTRNETDTYSFGDRKRKTFSRGQTQNLSKLRGLSASSLAHHNNALPPPEGLHKLLFNLVYRQGFSLDLDLRLVR